MPNRIAPALAEDKERVRFGEERRKYIQGYDIAEQETPYTRVVLDLNPKYPNINKYNCGLLFAYSKVNLVIIYSYNKYKEVTWGEYELEKVRWRKLSDIILKDEASIKNVMNNILDGFFEYVLSDLNKQFEIEPRNVLLELANRLENSDELAKAVEIADVTV